MPDATTAAALSARAPARAAAVRRPGRDGELRPPNECAEPAVEPGAGPVQQGVPPAERGNGADEPVQCAPQPGTRYPAEVVGRAERDRRGAGGQTEQDGDPADPAEVAAGDEHLDEGGEQPTAQGRPQSLPRTSWAKNRKAWANTGPIVVRLAARCQRSVRAAGSGDHSGWRPDRARPSRTVIYAHSSPDRPNARHSQCIQYSLGSARRASPRPPGMLRPENACAAKRRRR